MKKILLGLGKFFSYVIPYHLAVRLLFVRSYIYTGWITRFFRQMDGFINYAISLTGGKYISIGQNSVIGRGTVLQAWDNYQGRNMNPSIIIGSNVRIGENSHITAISNIVIGDGEYHSAM